MNKSKTASLVFCCCFSVEEEDEEEDDSALLFSVPRSCVDSWVDFISQENAVEFDSREISVSCPSIALRTLTSRAWIPDG